MKAVIIDPFNFTVDYVEIKSFDVVEDLYVKALNGDFIAAAYVFREEEFDFMVSLMATLADAKRKFDDYQAEVFYKILPQHSPRLKK